MGNHDSSAPVRYDNSVNALSLISEQPDHERLTASFLSGKSPATLKTYRACIKHFCQWAALPDSESAAAGLLLQLKPGQANELVLRYRTAMADSKLSPATTNLRLAAIRSLLKLARTHGIITWALEVPNLPNESYRDTAGPALAGIQTMVSIAESQANPVKAARDVAIVRILAGMGLRRSEVTGLLLEHVDLDNGRLSIHGKGRQHREWVSVPANALEALRAWLLVRPASRTDAVFTSLDNASHKRGTGAMTPDGLYQLVRKISADAGCKNRPHGIRHFAITQALKNTNGDVATVSKFSRHKSVAVLMIYADRLEDAAGKVSQGVDAVI